MRFEWDQRKAAANLRKHGVSFDEARTVFADRLGKIRYDPDHSEAEDRFIQLGRSSKDRLLLVWHCYRGGNVRIISARAASPADEIVYLEEE
ncbi:BrnT family toxin [Duganella sp. BJB488]|uniref:BrnT family toxin n=1 Tax=unclassified Duganella TaxID=2636909 RepID=UPI000E3570B7|nr:MULTISPECIES: BrnT family toxin [unclassified Duganella]NVD72851.1 BrnT family toxin [Duganella sp. BJB1802]RFP11685.1 BrnT family toxin [Duganella sp. BJB489]RFP15601.1 BrnT family toxin [Duganella sp. BJB488]RFP30549.1 BrnT family toxin [Duganella sp. BJB480]